jgi:hypothetical protein
MEGPILSLTLQPEHSNKTILEDDYGGDASPGISPLFSGFHLFAYLFTYL